MRRIQKILSVVIIAILVATFPNLAEHFTAKASADGVTVYRERTSFTTAELVSIAVIPANPSIASGLTQQFTATGTYADNSTVDLTASANWTSSNTTVAVINSAGMATSVGAGTTNITATWGAIGGSTTLAVTQVSGATVNISVVLQGGQRPAEGWVVPITVKFFTPGVDVM
ncbi:MAG: Ig-like domain-containing protein, partial [Chloroflexota bacterium]